jgi:hypothetical protein
MSKNNDGHDKEADPTLPAETSADTAKPFLVKGILAPSSLF